MTDGDDGGARGGRRSLEERQQNSHLHCPDVLLGLGCHYSSPHFDRHQQYSCQETSTKILTTPM